MTYKNRLTDSISDKQNDRQTDELEIQEFVSTIKYIRMYPQFHLVGYMWCKNRQTGKKTDRQIKQEILEETWHGVAVV